MKPVPVVSVGQIQFWKTRQAYWYQIVFREISMCYLFVLSTYRYKKLHLNFLEHKKKKQFLTRHQFFCIIHPIKTMRHLKEERLTCLHIHWFCPYNYFRILMFLWKISPKQYPQYSKYPQYNITLVHFSFWLCPS